MDKQIWIWKQWILISDKKKQLIHTRWILNIAKSKIPVPKAYVLYDSVYLIFWKKTNYRDGKQISICQGLGATD